MILSVVVKKDGSYYNSIPGKHTVFWGSSTAGICALTTSAPDALAAVTSL